MISLHSSSGFTLIEVLVVSLLSTVLGATILTTFYMVTAQIKESTELQKLSVMEAAVSEAIAQTAFKSDAVYENPCTMPAANPNTLVPVSRLTVIYFCKDDGSSVGGYRIDQDTLKELTAGNNWIPFQVGNELFVPLKGSPSSFFLLPKRLGLQYYLEFSRVVDGKPYSLPTFIELVQCRNTFR